MYTYLSLPKRMRQVVIFTDNYFYPFEFLMLRLTHGRKWENIWLLSWRVGHHHIVAGAGMFQEVCPGMVCSCHSSKERHVPNLARPPVPILWMVSITGRLSPLLGPQHPVKHSSGIRLSLLPSILYPLPRSQHEVLSISYLRSKWTEMTFH